MNDNMNLIEILKNVPRGTKLYCTIYGEVILDSLSLEEKRIYVKIYDNKYNTQDLDFLLSDGRLLDNEGECILFPSKEQRDWSKWKY